MANSNAITVDIQEAKSASFAVTGKVAEELSALLEDTLGSKEMGSTEVKKIASRLISFQLEQDVEASKEHED